MKTRRYSELRSLYTFEDRLKYLLLVGQVGASTFGFDRYLNQRFYTSREWRQVRHHVISRDQGRDLGIEGYEIYGRLMIHHMNPLSVQDIVDGHPDLFDPEFLITTTHQTHNAIHYGNERQLPRPLAERSRGDTKLW